VESKIFFEGPELQVSEYSQVYTQITQNFERISLVHCVYGPE